MANEQEPLVYVQAPEKVVSTGFIQHDLTTCSALLVFRPGADIEAILVEALAYFQQDVVQQAVDLIAERNPDDTKRTLN